MYTQEYLQREEINLSKGIDELKEWAMHNVRLISILPSNKNLPVDTKLTDVLEHDVDEKYYLSDEKTKKLTTELKNDDIKTFTYNRIQGLKTEINVAHTINQSDYRGLNRNQNQNCVVVPVLTPDRENKRQNGRQLKEDGEPMFTLTAQDRHG